MKYGNGKWMEMGTEEPVELLSRGLLPGSTAYFKLEA